MALSQAKVTQSRPEQIGQWLFKTTSNWRTVLAFLLVAALTFISIRFNIELGKLSAVDETSKQLLPTGYALLDLAALFLSGYVGLKTRSPVRKAIAWIWFAFLLTLSLWAAAAFTMSVDYRQSLAPLDAQIDQKRRELVTQSATVSIWQKNVEEAVRFKTRHQNTLSREQIKETMLAGELAHLEAQRVPPAQIIYERAAPYFGVDAAVLQLIIRLAWAAALTLSPIVLVLLIAVEFGLVKVGDHTLPPNERQKQPSGDSFHHPFRNQNAPNEVPSNVAPITANVPHEVHHKKRTRPSKDRVPQGVQRDTGTNGAAANRYDELKRSVLAGRTRPSVRRVRDFCGCNQEVAVRYIQSLAEEGVIAKTESGRWRLLTHVNQPNFGIVGAENER